jgi:L-threonylcarbamoyladenylate synthase
MLEPATSVTQLNEYFGAGLRGIVMGDLGGERRPSEIRDLASGRVLREG